MSAAATAPDTAAAAAAAAAAATATATAPDTKDCEKAAKSSSHKKKSGSSSSKSKNKFKLSGLTVNKSELIFVTDVNDKDKTFFGQLARNTNEELSKYGGKVHTISEQLHKTQGPIKKTSKDQLVGARFTDGNWYRAVVVNKSNSDQKALVTFIDWGNSEILSYDDIVEYTEDVDLRREPFGIICKYVGMLGASEEQINKLMEKLYNVYLLVKPRDEIHGVWHVDLPMVGYNAHFWKSANDNWQLVPTYPTADPFRNFMDKEKK